MNHRDNFTFTLPDLTVALCSVFVFLDKGVGRLTWLWTERSWIVIGSVM